MANFSAFGAALATVASKVVTAKKFVYNAARKANYSSLYYFLAGRKMSEMLRAGSDVRARVKFASSSKAGWYNVSTDDHAPSISQDGTWAIAYWAAHMAQDSWKEEPLLVNSGGTTDGSLAEETWTQEIYNTLQSLMTALYGSLIEGMWAPPNLTNMGGTDPKQPYSLIVYLNEWANSLWASDSGATGAGDAWTTIHGINPATEPRYRPYRATYGASGAGFTAGSIANLIFALSLAQRKTKFAPPPTDQNYFDPKEDTEIEGDKGVIFCSADGLARAEHLYRSSQDRWQDGWDPAGNPRFKNTMFVHEGELDSAAVYPNHTTPGSATGLVTESNTAGTFFTGPRYYGVNCQYAKMYFHKNRFLEFLKPFRESLTGWTQGVNTIGTMLCPDRSPHFLLSPAADQY